MLFHGELARSPVVSSLHGIYREIHGSTWWLWKQNLFYHNSTDCLSPLASSTTCYCFYHHQPCVLCCPLMAAIYFWNIFQIYWAVEALHGGKVLFSMVILLFTTVHEMSSLLLSVSWRFGVTLEVLDPAAIHDYVENLGLMLFCFFFLISNIDGVKRSLKNIGMALIAMSSEIIWNHHLFNFFFFFK